MSAQRCGDGDEGLQYQTNAHEILTMYLFQNFE